MLKFSGQRFIRQFPPGKSGFIVERGVHSDQKLDAKSRYVEFWFNDKLPLDAVLSRHTPIIGLHHSWTPPWYTLLGFEDLAEDSSLLSRFLRSLCESSKSMNLQAFQSADSTLVAHTE